MFRTVFNKLHVYPPTGIKITYNMFSQYYYIPYLEKWPSIFIQHCIECQRNKQFNMKIQTTPTQSFSEHDPSFNYRFLWIRKDLSTLLHTTNPTFMLYSMFPVTLLLQYQSKQIPLKQQ